MAPLVPSVHNGTDSAGGIPGPWPLLRDEHTGGIHCDRPQGADSSTRAGPPAGPPSPGVAPPASSRAVPIIPRGIPGGFGSTLAGARPRIGAAEPTAGDSNRDWIPGNHRPRVPGGPRHRVENGG